MDLFRHALLSLLVVGTAASAQQQTCQTIMLSTCQVDLFMGSLDHIQNNFPEVSAARDGGTGTVALYCPLINNAGVESFSSDDADHWGHWTLIARDPDDAALQHDVSAQLLAFSRTDNGQDNISDLSSSLSPGTAIGNMTEYAVDIDEYTFDFRAWDYLVVVNVIRQSTPEFAAGRSIQFCPGKI